MTDGRKLKVAACGGRAIDGHHVSKCKECQYIYNRRYRDRVGYKHPPAQCVLCGLSRRNGRGIKVYRYPLLRKVAGTTRRSHVIGSIGLCDPCITEHARPSPTYIRAHGHGFGRRAA